MYSGFQEREELEDELYREDEEGGEGSEASSELEFHLYSQVHYSANVEEERHALGDSGAGGLSSRYAEGPQDHDGQLRNVEGSAKRRKVKGRPAASPSQSSDFDDVIVIDSGTEVITLSDDSDDGVCVLKGLKSKIPAVSSTPVPTAQKRKKRSSLDSVVLLDSWTASELEGAGSDSMSGSDVVESWMILGGAMRAEDRSISLNMEGESDSSSDFHQCGDGSWLVSCKDKEARIYNRGKGTRPPAGRMRSRYYEPKGITCRSCNKTGHLSKNCPTPKKVVSCFLCGTPGHQVTDCPNRLCNNCSQPGHKYLSCSEKSYWHTQCHRCGMTGHLADSCPEIWRQYHITTKAGPPVKLEEYDTGRSSPYCSNCSQKGHFGFECKRQRMFNGTYPSTPFINYYDNMADIRSREHRMKFKFQELQKKGHFSRVPYSPGPPKKKMKANHHPSHESCLASNNHPRPANSFFSNDKHRHYNKKDKKGDQHNKMAGDSSKSWKPKRPVPKTAPARRVVNEDDDFPRERTAVVKKKKKGKTNKGPHLENLIEGRATVETNRKKSRNERRERNMANGAAANMYPSDENLFIIKQRKRKR